MVGGQTLPPASMTRSTTKVLMPSIPSAGTSILRNEPFSEPEPLGIISRRSVRGRSTKSMLTTGTRMPDELCSFFRVSGCTTDERSGYSFVARATPRPIAAFSATPSTSTSPPISTL